MELLLEMEKAFSKIQTYFTKESLTDFLNCSYDDLYHYHYSFGKWIRNHILLEGDLFNIFQNIGITQADDMSYFLIVLFYMDQHTKQT